MSQKKGFQLLIKSQSRWFNFEDPIGYIQANSPADVIPALKQLDSHLKASRSIAGFISYEASQAIDHALTTKPPDVFPLLLFGVFEKYTVSKELNPLVQNFKTGKWKTSQSKIFYVKNINKIKELIASGETYQVNYTMRLNTDFAGDPLSYFYYLEKNQDAEFSAFVDTADFSICSVSPELFFRIEGDQLLSRPMKGTAARGLWYDDDMQQSESLKKSEKERAENIMITDMIRNDMGKICKPGSVTVSNVFNTDRFPTLWQMTSDVTGKTDVELSNIIRALFPCASITGAPKARTMNIINDLEKAPRHIYTGSIGYCTPDRNAQFNVAIRSVLINKKKGSAEYGVGSGIVWDSIAEKEYEECRIKSRVLKQQNLDFRLLETMLFEDNKIFLLDYHLKRIKQSADYFNFKINLAELETALKNIQDLKQNVQFKIRLLLAKNGHFETELHPLKKGNAKDKLKIGLAEQPILQDDKFLYHKTTNRKVYKKHQHYSAKNNFDDVILWNINGEITESTIANVVVYLDGVYYTPPQRCGLLNGTYRQYLLDNKKIHERIIHKDELVGMEKIVLINSVSKWQETSLVKV